MRWMLSLAAALASLSASGTAFAHAHLVQADPPVESAVATAPAQLRLKFNEVIRPAASGVQLVTPAGKAVLLAPLRKDPKDPRAVIAPVPAGLAPGKYLVRWRALSPDGHRTEGEFGFSIKG